MVRVLLDTYSIFFRAFHALPAMNTADGTPTQALYGFCVLLLKLLRERAPCEVALALEGGGENLRRRELAEYKANRPELPESLVRQLGLLDELIAALGFPAFRVRGYEADDVLATLAHRLEPAGDLTMIASGDRDLLQTVRERVHVLFLGKRGAEPVIYDRARVRERFGVEPEQLPSYVAFVGDPSDNIPKIPGIGPRTAAELIAKYGSASAVLEHASELAPRLQATFREHGAALLRNERIVRLHDTLELESDRLTAPLTDGARARTAALLERLEFRSLLPRLAKL